MEGKPQNVRVRIAPSPTGYFHVGNARTAVFNWLFARKYGGAFILRIEDTDKERSRKEYEDDIRESLKWLGLDWDEACRQSDRVAIHREYLEKLLSEKKAYWCFCKKEDLEAERQSQFANGLAAKYGGHCREHRLDETAARQAAGERAVIRLKVPAEGVEFHDMIRGRVTFDMSLVGDIVIAKDLDAPLYNFSAAVDDALMNITHVIRGEDHLANTPKQILLQRALGFGTPEYAHLPLLLAPNRSKLSKRFGDTAVRDYRKNGYLSETLANFLVLLGWHPTDDREIMSMQEAIERFSIQRVQKGGAVWNEEKLDWLNAHYIRAMNADALYEALKGFLPESWQAREKLVREAVKIEQARMKHLTDLVELAGFFIECPPYEGSLLVWKTGTAEKTKQNLEQIIRLVENAPEDELEKQLMAHAEREGRAETLWPLRVALSGQKTSPGPFEIIIALGKKESLRRITEAIKKLTAQ